MIDLIEKQKAIDAAIKADMENNSNVLSEKRAGVIDRHISAVPSAQPELIHCRDCKYAEVADAQDNQDGYTCQFHRGSIWFSGSYCSWGERRADERSD